MKVKFRKNKWREWTEYIPESGMEMTIICLLYDIKHCEQVLAWEFETTIDAVIEYSDFIEEMKAELNAILA